MTPLAFYCVADIPGATGSDTIDGRQSAGAADRHYDGIRRWHRFRFVAAQRRASFRRCSVRYSAGTSRRSARRVARDRKSTRLNSSHVAISYAVFCLKKKKEPVAGLQYFAEMEIGSI